MNGTQKVTRKFYFEGGAKGGKAGERISAPGAYIA